MSTPASASGVAPVRSLRRDAVRNRERLLVAANEVFAERGLKACLTEVAERAGVGMGTIYRRFPDKEGLIAALLDAKLDEINDMASLAASQPSGWEAFAALLEGLTDLLAGDKALAELMLTEYGRQHGRTRLAPYRAQAANIMARAQAEGSLRADLAPTDLSPLLNMATAAADFTAHLGRTVWPRYLQALLDGLRATPTNQPLGPAALSDQELAVANRSSWSRKAQVANGAGPLNATGKDEPTERDKS